MKTYRRPARHKRNPVGPTGSNKPLPERPTVLVRKMGAVPLSDNAEVSQLMPVAIARARWGSASWRTRWHNIAKHFGLGWQPVVPEENAYLSGGATNPDLDRNITIEIEVWGAGEALAAALETEPVVSWQYRTKTASPDKATEIGRAKLPQNSKAKSKPPTNHAFTEHDKLTKPYTVKGYKLPESDGPDGFVRK